MINEINLLMTCSWMFGDKIGDGSERTTIDGPTEVHSAYENHVDAVAAAEFYKHDDEISGLHNSKYWVMVVPVESKAPTDADTK